MRLDQLFAGRWDAACGSSPCDTLASWIPRVTPQTFGLHTRHEFESGVNYFCSSTGTTSLTVAATARWLDPTPVNQPTNYVIFLVADNTFNVGSQPISISYGPRNCAADPINVVEFTGRIIMAMSGSPFVSGVYDLVRGFAARITLRRGRCGPAPMMQSSAPQAVAPGPLPPEDFS